MTTFLLKPAPGRRVRDPDTLRILADAGEDKPQTSYWLRRINDGDVVIVVPAEPVVVDPPRKTAKVKET